MEFKKIYNEYENVIKTGIKTVGYSAGALLAGFFIYYWKNRKQLMSGEQFENKPEAKQVPVEKLEKIVNKIKNLIIHNMTLMYDLSHKYDADEFKKKDDDIEIEEVALEEVEKSAENSELFGSESVSENINKKKNENSEIKKQESRVDAFKREYRPLVDQPKYRDEKLLSYEIAKLKQFELEPEDYYNSLKKNLNNEKIRKNVKIIADFKQHFNRDELMKIDFGEALTHNYLKIITNIYYLNLRKTQKKFKEEFVDKGHDFRDASETANTFNDIYKSFLKETRSEVLGFFKVTTSDVLSPKVMLRIYPFYFSPYHPMRIQYEKINQEVNLLIKKIQTLGCIEELYNDSHPEAIIKPTDKIIEFSHLLNQKVESLEIPPQEEDKTRKERILNKYDEVYKGKKSDEDLD